VILLGFMLQLAASGDASGAVQCLPGPTEALLSPSERVVLSLGTYDEARSEHRLMLSLNGGTPKEIHKFGRSVCVTWENEERRFALTDNQGSNSSETYVVSVDAPKKVENLNSLLPEAARSFLENASHGYVEVINWEESGLRVRIWGDTLTDSRKFNLVVNCLGWPKLGKCSPLRVKAN